VRLRAYPIVVSPLPVSAIDLGSHEALRRQGAFARQDARGWRLPPVPALPYPEGMFGFLNVNKPPGPTSHDVVAEVRRRLPGKTKAGHAGTLDPFAAGVLVLCVGPATRLASYVQTAPKRYSAGITLGASSGTDDLTGEITNTPNAGPPFEEQVRQALARWVGQVQQVPPAHSAVHVSGRRAYKLARRGETPELPPRAVAIHAIELLRYEYPELEIDVRCGSGTYIRALARDVGADLGVGGYCSRLSRTEVGPFRIDSAVALEAVDPAADLISPIVAVGHLPKIAMDAESAGLLAHGKTVRLPAPHSPGETAVVTQQGDLLAIARVCPDGTTLAPRKVFLPG